MAYSGNTDIITVERSILRMLSNVTPNSTPLVYSTTTPV